MVVSELLEALYTELEPTPECVGWLLQEIVDAILVSGKPVVLVREEQTWRIGNAGAGITVKIHEGEVMVQNQRVRSSVNLVAAVAHQIGQRIGRVSVPCGTFTLAPSERDVPVRRLADIDFDPFRENI